ncbi:MAG: response regulator [Lachnospiraceae bacterium]|nr:response regulator [Lachnospiraceae bacterium]
MQLLMKGLLNNCDRALLIDLENDKVLDVMHCFHENEIEEVYSRMLERYVVLGNICEEDVSDICNEASVENLRLKLSTNDKMEIPFRYREGNGNFIRMTSRYAVCDRKDGVATYAVLTFERHDNSFIDKEPERELYEYSYQIWTSVNSIMGMLEMEERNAEDIELLKHIRKKETQAIQEVLEVADRITEKLGIPRINHEEVLENKSFERNSIRGKHVLLVEDNELNMDIAEYMLSEAGAVIAKAVNGLEAWEQYHTKPAGTFDAILMDIQMPVMDGYEATKRIRSSDHADAKTIPIIAMTAGVFSKDVEAAKQAGMNEYIIKPLNGKELVNAVAATNTTAVNENSSK